MASPIAISPRRARNCLPASSPHERPSIGKHPDYTPRARQRQNQAGGGWRTFVCCQSNDTDLEQPEGERKNERGGHESAQARVSKRTPVQALRTTLTRLPGADRSRAQKQDSSPRGAGGREEDCAGRSADRRKPGGHGGPD